jgi:hypothetical protein
LKRKMIENPMVKLWWTVSVCFIHRPKWCWTSYPCLWLILLINENYLNSSYCTWRQYPSRIYINLPGIIQFIQTKWQLLVCCPIMK